MPATPTILVVDDNVPALTATVRILEKAGYEVTQAGDGASALREVRARRPSLVLLDAILPDLSGPEVLRQIRTDPALARVSVVLLSSLQTNPEQQAAGLDAGADGYIARPIANAELLARVRLQLRQRELTEQLRASEQQFSTAFESAAIGMALIAPNGRYLKVNRALCQMLGYAEAELQALTCQELTFATDLDDQGQLARLLAGESESFQMEKRYRHRQGHLVTGLLSVSLARDEMGQPVHQIAQIQDITAHKQAEEANVRARERLHEAQRIGQIGDWEFDLSTGAITWSPQTFAILGRDPNLGPPQSYEENAALYEPASAALMAEKVAAAIASGEDQEYELVALRPDGRRVPVQARAVARKDGVGTVVALSGTVQDVSARQRAERLVRESEERLSFALTAAGIGDWDMDLRTNVARRSLRHDQCFGYSAPVPEWGYDTFLAHVQPVDRDRVDDTFQKAMAGGGDYDVEFQVAWPDGSRHWLWSKGRFYLDDAGLPWRVAGIQVDISERRQAEEAAHRLAAIVESSDDAIIGQDLGGCITSWNDGAERLFGYTAAEMIGQSILRLIPRERHDEEAHITKTVKRGVALKNFETVRQTKDGRLIDISVTISPIKDAAGRIIGASKIARDIAEQKKAADQLQRSEASLANAQRIARIGNWDLEIATGALSWSAEIYEIFGITRGEFGASYEAFMAAVHPDDRARMAAGQRAALAGEARLDLEHRLVRPDGTERVVHELADLTRDAAGQPTHLAGTVQDITARVQAEAKLRESEETFSAAFRASPMAMVITTLESCFVEVNEAYCTLIGLPREEIIGRTVVELGLLSAGARETIVGTVESAGGTLGGLEYEMQHRDGTPRNVIAGVTEITLHGVRHRLSTAINVTEQRRTERASRESELRYRRLFESSKDGILILDAETGMVLDVNPFLIGLLGFSHEEFLGKKIWELGFFNDIVANQDNFAELQQMEYIRYEDMALETHDGRRIEVEFTSNLYLVDRHKVIHCDIRDISVRKAAEEKQRASDFRYRRLFETTKDGILILDAETGMVMDVNPFLIELLGFSHEEFLGKKIWELGFFKDVVANQDNFAELQRKEYIRYEDMALETYTGRRIEVEFTSNLYLVDRHKVIQCDIRDISVRKRVEAERNTLERQRKLALDAARLGWWYFDPVTRVNRFDDRCQEIFGVEGHEVPEATMQNLVDPEDAPKVWGAVGAALDPADPKLYAVEFRIPHQAGAVCWVEVHGVAEFAGEGDARHAVSLVGTMADITERKQAEQAIRGSEEYFRFLNDLANATRQLSEPGQVMAVMTRMLGAHLNASRCAYADVASDGEQFAILHDYTDGCASTVGHYQLSSFGGNAVTTLHRGQTLIIRNVAEELLPDDGADMFDAIGIQAIITCPLVKAGGLRAMMALHQSTPRDWRPWEISLVEDVVERCWAMIERLTAEAEVLDLNTRLEQRVAERTSQLETANKELESFSYSVSHDLRAPLRAVNGFAKIVIDTYAPQLPAEAREYLEDIRTGGEQMGQLIDDLLAFSRLGRQTMKSLPVETARLVQRVLDDLAPQLDGRPFEIQLGDLPGCHGDPSLLKQVWLNLLSNAIKYTRGRTPAVIKIGCQLIDTENVFFVRDNGAGFDMRYVHKLFGVFQRLHRADEFEGTGVGLAIVQRIIHRHGGRVWAESETGKGAIFHFTLNENGKS